MDLESVIAKVEQKVRQAFEGEGTGHDWHHIDRVRRNALRLSQLEGGDKGLIELASLLHDIADHKFYGNDLSIGPTKAKEIVMEYGGTEILGHEVAQIVSEVSFKGAGEETPVNSLEAAIVQDADRLDALGAIGIARAFAYGGSKHRELYNPDKPPQHHSDFMAYAKNEGSTINHFYEKLFLLKDRMQTTSGKALAEERHSFMLEFVKRFKDEWESLH